MRNTINHFQITSRKTRIGGAADISDIFGGYFCKAFVDAVTMYNSFLFHMKSCYLLPVTYIKTLSTKVQDILVEIVENYDLVIYQYVECVLRFRVPAVPANRPNLTTALYIHKSILNKSIFSRVNSDRGKVRTICRNRRNPEPVIFYSFNNSHCKSVLGVGDD